MRHSGHNKALFWVLENRVGVRDEVLVLLPMGSKDTGLRSKRTVISPLFFTSRLPHICHCFRKSCHVLGQSILFTTACSNGELHHGQTLSWLLGELPFFSRMKSEVSLIYRDYPVLAGGSLQLSCF